MKQYWKRIETSYAAFAGLRDPVVEIFTVRKKSYCHLCGHRAGRFVILKNLASGRSLRVGLVCNRNRLKVADRWWDRFFRRERVRAWREGRLDKDLV